MDSVILHIVTDGIDDPVNLDDPLCIEYIASRIEKDGELNIQFARFTAHTAQALALMHEAGFADEGDNILEATQKLLADLNQTKEMLDLHQRGCI